MRKKLRLNLEDLEIESFATARTAPKVPGTVFGLSPTPNEICTDNDPDCQAGSVVTCTPDFGDPPETFFGMWNGHWVVCLDNLDSLLGQCYLSQNDSECSCWANTGCDSPIVTEGDLSTCDICNNTSGDNPCDLCSPASEICG